MKLKKSWKEVFLSKILLTAHADNIYTPPATRTDTLPETIRDVYSKEIEYQALPNMRFFQFAEQRTELGTEPGLTIKMLTYDNLQLGGKLKENQDIKSQAMSGSYRQITVTEYGNAISESELHLRASFDDVMANAAILLGRDYALVVDIELRNVALSGTNVIYGRKNGTTKVASRAGMDDTCKFNVALVKDAIEILSSANAPKYNGTNWICFVHPHQSRDLRDDPAWINASDYGNPEQLFTGEIGRIDDTRFIETTILSNGAAAPTDYGYDADLKKGATPEGATVANPVNVFKSVIFGDSYYGIAFGLPVELRDDGVIDHGRKRSLAWYAIFGVGMMHDSYGVVMETA